LRRHGYAARVERTVDVAWGEHGIRALAQTCDVLVIVDVLSFTTCVSVAVSHGGSIVVARTADEALEFAAGAEIATRRSAGGRYTLSPRSYVGIAPGTRVVLPSVNGSTLSRIAVSQPVLAGCLRNRTAVARRAAELGSRIGIVAAGERWPGTSDLRPCIEDWLGAGAIAELLDGRSGMALAASAAFVDARWDLRARLEASPSGEELAAVGFADDVDAAVELDADDVAPQLRAGAYSV
jgi:2-phosphosulfolactate phosphatase